MQKVKGVERRLERRRVKKNQALQVEQERITRLRGLGRYLQQYRLKKGLSLEQVSHKTKLRLHLLQAIEEGQMERLPEPIYIRWHLKHYAEALGLDGNLFANAFPVDAKAQVRRLPWHFLRLPQLRPLHLYILYVVVIVLAINGLSYITEGEPITAMGEQQSSGQTQGIAPSGLPPAQRLSGRSSALNSQSTQPVLSPTIPSEEVRVSVTLKSQSWIRVVADGQQKFEGVLDEGSHRTWAAREKLTLTAGNAGGVLVAVNNGQATPMGAPGTVEEVTFAKNQAINPLPFVVGTASRSLAF